MSGPLAEADGVITDAESQSPDGDFLCPDDNATTSRHTTEIGHSPLTGIFCVRTSRNGNEVWLEVSHSPLTGIFCVRTYAGTWFLRLKEEVTVP